MEYVLENSKYNLSYSELKEKYHEFCNLKTKDFLNRLPEALHLACVISWLKELGNDSTISDKGIIHELIHLLHIPNEAMVNVEEIRQQFERILILS